MTIEVDLAGMNVLRDAVHKNENYIRDIHGFVSDHCKDFGAFTGFLAVFKGDYEDAYNNAEKSVHDGHKSAKAIRNTIVASRKRYEDADIESSVRLKGIDLHIVLPKIPGMTADGGPLVTKTDKNVASGAGLIEDLDEGIRELERIGGDGPQHRGPGKGSPFPIIGLLGETESTVDITKDGMAANDDIDDYNDFENKGNR
ncbi:MAG: hypothetical protein ABIP45_04050 [Knoellia sp.]